MAFSVLLTNQALDDIDEHTRLIAQDSLTQAARWRDTLEALILSLADAPDRFDVIPEAARLKRPYRSVGHFSHRVVYRIDEPANTVFVVRVYHGARKPLAKKDIQ